MAKNKKQPSGSTEKKWDVKMVQEQFGPLKLIDRKRETELMKANKWNHVLTLMSEDVGYEDLPEDDRPSDEELKDRGETKEEYSQSRNYMAVGHHLVNMSEIYESAKPLPEDLTIDDEGVWFEEDGLPT